MAKSRVFRIEISDAEHRAEAARTKLFSSWLDECSAIHDQVVESLLANLRDGE